MRGKVVFGPKSCFVYEQQCGESASCRVMQLCNSTLGKFWQSYWVCCNFAILPWESFDGVAELHLPALQLFLNVRATLQLHSGNVSGELQGRGMQLCNYTLRKFRGKYRNAALQLSWKPSGDGVAELQGWVASLPKSSVPLCRRIASEPSKIQCVSVSVCRCIASEPSKIHCVSVSVHRLRAFQNPLCQCASVQLQSLPKSSVSVCRFSL